MARKVQKKRASGRARRPECFVISPIGEVATATRRHANAVLRKIIKPAMSKLGHNARRIDQRGDDGSITQAIVDRLQTSHLCIAVLTGSNPNVMYEVGVRNAWDLPLIVLAEIGTKLPFDVQDQNTVWYALESKTSVLAATRELTKRVRSIGEKLEAPNPRVPPRILPMFSEAMATLGSRYSLDSLFVGKANTLKRLMRQIRRLSRELAKDYESGNLSSSPLKCHADALTAELDSFASALEVFDDIVVDTNHQASPRSHCDGILRDMKLLQRNGWRLLKKLKEAPGSGNDFARAIREFDSLLESCQAILTRIV